LAIARALLALNKRVTIITDSWCSKMMAAAQRTAFPSEVHSSLVVCPQREEFDATEWSTQVLEEHKLDHLVSIERVGPAQDGKCYNMRGADITAFTAPLHSLFLTADSRGIFSTGIGDGGNEIGMGKVLDMVKEHVPHGERIGCSIATQNLIVTGVSNWGGYGLAMALFMLARENLATVEVDKNLLHSRIANLAQKMLPSKEQESKLLDVILEAGAVDGLLRVPARSVDGLAFDNYVEYLERLTNLIKT